MTATATSLNSLPNLAPSGFGPKDLTANDRILYIRLPCNPIFPIGVVYLADHVHKLFPLSLIHI